MARNANSVKIFLRILSVFLLLIIAACGAGFYYVHEAIKPAADSSVSAPPQIVEIASGASFNEVVENLESKHLVRSALALKLLARFNEHITDVKAGFFRVDPTQPPVKILQMLVAGQTVTKKITFPEGLNLKECAAVVKKTGTCDSQEFYELVTKHGSDFGADFPNNLEGYLLPDTYQVPWVCSAHQLVSIMTARFNELARPQWDAKSPLPFRDTIILASLVEREAQVAAERPLIAGVYVNRLNDGQKLECDATIQYILGKQKEFLLFSDLKIDSPYNSYMYPGLPPGPICCPGLAAIKAACHPQMSGFYYYVRNDVKGDGSHVFSKNYTEHCNAINNYQR